MGFWWILLVGLIFMGIVWMRRRYYSDPQKKTPMDILKERYARGEISKQEYEEIKKDLS